MKTKIISDVKALGAAIVSIKTRGAKLDADIHVAALSAAAHFEKCGDVGFINRLFLAMGKGARHVAMIEWLTQFGGVTANEGESKDTTPFVKDRNKVVDLEGGDAMPWYDCKPSPKPDQVLDYLALLMKVVTKKAKDDQEVKNASVLGRVQAVLKAYEEELAANADTDGVEDTADETLNKV